MSRPILLILGAGLALGIFLLAGGEIIPGSDPRIIIHWGMYPEIFEGLDVEIDGQPAGELTMMGVACRTVFPVERGVHTVRVVHPSFESQGLRVDLPLRAQDLRIMLELDDFMSPKGEAITRIVLRR